MELTLDEALVKAISAHKSGKLKEAEQLYRAILSQRPRHPAVNHNLGNLIINAGNPQDALPYLKVALEQKRNRGEFWLSYINALIEAKHIEEALQILSEGKKLGLLGESVNCLEKMLQEEQRNTLNQKLSRTQNIKFKQNKIHSLKVKNRFSSKAKGPSQQQAAEMLATYNAGNFELAASQAKVLTQLFPDHPLGWMALGAVLKQVGKLDASLEVMLEAVRLAPNDPNSQLNLGAVLNDLDRLEEAEKTYRQAIRLKPDYAEAYNNIGVVLRRLARYVEAEESYLIAIGLKPDYAEAYGNLGNVLNDLGRPKQAEERCLKAIGLKPHYAEAYSSLGNAVRSLGRLSEAEANYREAIRIKPTYAEAYNNLGNALRDLGRLEEAEASYREAIRHKSNYADAYSNLGVVLYDLGRLAEAQESYRLAVKLRPDAVEYRYKQELLLPEIYDSNASIRDWRSRYERGLHNLIKDKHALVNPAQITTTHTFNLAYHNQSNLELMKQRSRLVREKVYDSNFVSPHVLSWKKPFGQKIKIGFCSQFLVGHTIGKLYQGIIKQLDRSVFEVILIHGSGSKRDHFSNDLDASVDKAIQLSSFMSDQLTQISREKLDIIFYPDIGMYPETYYLAHARLAPVQVVSWGHPDTTGIDTLDYFISSSLIEPDNAEQQYSERLIRLHRLPCYYQPLIVPSQISCRESVGLPTEGALYGCPQSLFKFHPEFDRILAEIVSRDPTGRIILLEGRSPAWAGMLRARWERDFPILNKKVQFLPRQPLDKFMKLIGHLDVLLDPIHFGSGNTMYESKAYGVPTVTWQGQFMRGRIVAGAYKQMGIEDAPVANQVESYASVAVGLGKNPDNRHYFKQQILNSVEGSLYSDEVVVHELEEFFKAAIDAAEKGEKLPAGWMPTRSLN